MYDTIITIRYAESVKQIEEIKLTPNNCDKCGGELDSNRDCRNYCSDEIELTPNNKE